MPHALNAIWNTLLRGLAFETSFLAFRKSQSPGPNPLLWTVDKLKDTGQKLIDAYQCIPPQEWLIANGYAGFLKNVHKHGGLNKFRELFETSSTNRLISKPGICHDSFPEVCVADFLWSMGIQVKKGRKYPSDYSEMSGKAFGYYDLEFLATVHPFTDQWVLIEIWGDINIRNDDYSVTKGKKLEYNALNPNFLAFPHVDCYKEERLILHFDKFIGVAAIVNCDSDMHSRLPSAVWTLADEVVQECQTICDNMDDGVMPSFNWLLRRENYADRVILSWEPTSWAKLTQNIKRIGGIVKVRELLDQSNNSNRKWNRESTILAVTELYENHSEWPGPLLTKLSKLSNPSPEQERLRRYCKSLTTAMRNHVGRCEATYSIVKAKLSTRC